MARIDPVSQAQAGWSVRITYWFTRRAITALTGRRTEAMIEPVQVYARIPALLRGYAKLEQATAGLTALPDRVKALAELRAATLTACEYCVDLGSQVARRWGLTDAQLLALPAYRSSDLFTDADKLVLDYATAMSRTPVEVTDELFAALREQFDDTQLVELTHVIALENLRARFNLALGIGAAGFSAGPVCAVPASPTTRHDHMSLGPPSPQPGIVSSFTGSRPRWSSLSAWSVVPTTCCGSSRSSPLLTQLGYPAHLATILGTAKVLAGLVVAAPRLPRLKEWAYAGILINMLGAAASYLATGSSVGGYIPPLSFAASP